MKFHCHSITFCAPEIQMQMRMQTLLHLEDSLANSGHQIPNKLLGMNSLAVGEWFANEMAKSFSLRKLLANGSLRQNALAIVNATAWCTQVGYVLVDSEFKLHGLSAYKWVTLNLLGVTFEMTYGKKLLQGAEMKSPVWGATLYTNFLAFVPMLIVALSTGEVDEMKQMDGSQLTAAAIAWLVISCVIGVGISWSGWNARNGVSATVFTILGVVCKILSVLMNMLIWNHHSSPRGLVPLLDGPHHSRAVELLLARVVAAIGITSARWRSCLPHKTHNAKIGHGITSTRWRSCLPHKTRQELVLIDSAFFALQSEPCE